MNETSFKFLLDLIETLSDYQKERILSMLLSEEIVISRFLSCISKEERDSLVESLRFKEDDIALLEMSMKTTSCLRFNKINTIKDLICLTQFDLTQIKCLGKKSLYEIKDALTFFGLKLKD